MNLSQDGIPLQNLTSLFCVLLIIGILLCLPLYRFDWLKFFKSKLFVKIIFWIPIFLTFIIALYANNWLRLVILVLILIGVLLEIISQIKKKGHEFLLIGYFLLFSLSLWHFYFIGKTSPADFTNILITICFATVLADVFAFFLGNYLGNHKLPPAINPNKSWEGVFGEFIGAFVGVLLVNIFIQGVISICIFIPIGIGAIFGDLANSYVKRKLSIKDWSNALPGHGGFTDRFSSIAGSALLVFYYLEFIL